MKHSIFYEIQTAEILPYRALFNDNFLEYKKGKQSFTESNIYMFCKVKKCRFDLNSTFAVDKINLSTKLIINNNIIDINTTFYEAAIAIRNIHKTKNDFIEFMNNDKFFINCKFRPELSHSDTLQFTYTSVDNGDFEVLLTPENFTIDLDLETNNYPEIVYIGQSIQMLNRLQSHKTLHRVISQLSDDEEILIYLLTFKYGVGGIQDYVNPKSETFNLWLRHDKKSKDYLNRISLVERFLIYFFKPRYNEQHVNTKISQDNLVKQLLIKNKVDSVSLGIGMYGKPFQFWSKHRPNPSELSTFDFRSPELGFQTGMKSLFS